MQRGVTGQCGNNRQREGELGAPHQPVKMHRIYKAAGESFEYVLPLANQRDSGMVSKHQTVVFPEKIGAQLSEEEVTEGLLVNGHDAREIVPRGVANPFLQAAWPRVFAGLEATARLIGCRPSVG